MATYFETVSKSFIDVPVTDEGVETTSFLEASEGLVKIFDLLGSKAFSIVQADLNGNITKIRARQTAHPATSKTLEQIVESEKNEKTKTATQALLWLTRSLSFTGLALKHSHENKAEELSVSFGKSYESTLKQYHGMLVRPVFSLAMKACPYRADFYAKLGSPQEKVQEELGKWLGALDALVKRLEAFYAKGNYGKGL